MKMLILKCDEELEFLHSFEEIKHFIQVFDLKNLNLTQENYTNLFNIINISEEKIDNNINNNDIENKPYSFENNLFQEDKKFLIFISSVNESNHSTNEEINKILYFYFIDFKEYFKLKDNNNNLITKMDNIEKHLEFSSQIINNNIPMLEMGTDFLIKQASDYFLEHFKENKEKIIDFFPLLKKEGINESDTKNYFIEELKTSQKINDTFQYTNSNSNIFHIKIMAELYSNEEEGEYYLIFIEDVTKDKLILDLQTIDELTGSLSRKKLNEIIPYELSASRRHQHKSTLIYISVVHIDKNRIEDNLINFSSNIKKFLRTTDHFGRFEENDFIMILPHTDVKNSEILIKKIFKFNEKYINNFDLEIYFQDTLFNLDVDIDEKYPNPVGTWVNESKNNKYKK
jgi:GGDEF domain-containing protein